MNAIDWNKALLYLQVAGLALTIAALPLSNFAMSLGSFWLAGVWLLQVTTDLIRGVGLSARWKRFLAHPNLLLLSSFYGLLLLGLCWTSDFKYAQWDMRIKLPLLFFPFLLATLNPISKRIYLGILGIFLLSLACATIFCLMIYWRMVPIEYNDVRDISVFISHIRFTLLMMVGLCITYNVGWSKIPGKILLLLLLVLFGYFLYVIGSVTGFVILAILVCLALLRSFNGQKSKGQKLLIYGLLFSFPLVCALYVQSSWQQYFNAGAIDWNSLEKSSTLGNPYDHTPQYKLIENGHYVMTHIAWAEIPSAWNGRSNISFDSTDKKGNALKSTFFRYMASKGLRKDADGIAQLSDADITAIENGATGVNENLKSGLEKRMENIFFEVANHRAGGGANGHSVLQRVEFWRHALIIISHHPWMGVGTGDVQTAFDDQYKSTNSSLDKEHRLRAHNQYLTIWLTYGILGLVLFMVVILKPLLEKKSNLLLRSFLIIAALSFLTEDTLETQAGVMFFVFFYTFFTLNPSQYILPPRLVQLKAVRPSKDDSSK